MNIVRIAGFGPVVPDAAAGRSFYQELLGIPLSSDDAYPQTDELDGADHFALWLLSSAANSFFGSPDWPSDETVPQAWLELTVTNLTVATAEVRSAGHRIFLSEQMMPWGQTVTRFQSPEGMLVELAEEQ